MSTLSVSESADQVVVRIGSLPSFALIERGEPYQHMGALITDAMLQSGMRYERQVMPRVQRILQEYPDAVTSSAFAAVLSANTPQHVVGINGRKAIWVEQLTFFFVAQEVETIEQLRAWLVSPAHSALLREQKGVGLKTSNYLRLLAGIYDRAAIDTHLRTFLAQAGVPAIDDIIAGQIIAEVAQRLGVSAGALDMSIWSYQSRLATSKAEAAFAAVRGSLDAI